MKIQENIQLYILSCDDIIIETINKEDIQFYEKHKFYEYLKNRIYDNKKIVGYYPDSGNWVLCQEDVIEDINKDGGMKWSITNSILFENFELNKMHTWIRMK